MKTQGQHKAMEPRLQQRLAELERENTQLWWENQTLRTSEARYRSCFENSPISIIFIAADGRPVEANRAFEQQYGMTIAQLSDRNCNIFTDPQLVENGTLPYMQQALAGETVMEPMTYYDAGKTVPGGRFHWGQGLYYPIRDETGTVREIVEMAFDRTQQVEAQQAWLRERERASQEQVELAQALAQQVALAIQLTRLAEQSREAAISEERNRMAQEIHDSLAQAFTGIIMQLQAATCFLRADSEQSQSCITRAQDLARSGLVQARRSVEYLSQSDAQDNDLDLFGTLTRTTEQLTAGTSVQAQVYIEGTPYRLHPEVGMNLLRIAQESLTNALRHSMAQTIQISLVYEAERIVLRVWDNGQGFNLQNQTSSGFGLKGMQQRCDRIGAHLEINTQPGAGTEIVVVMVIGNG